MLGIHRDRILEFCPQPILASNMHALVFEGLAWTVGVTDRDVSNRAAS